MRGAAVLLLALALAGCRDGAPPAAPPSASAPALPAASAASAAATDSADVVVGRWHVRALGEREGDLLHVRRLEVREAGRDALRQVIDGLQTDTPWTADRPGLEVVDMDFDGQPDLRLIEFRAAGPNTPWLHWRHDAAVDRFVASPELDALSPTRFDAARRLVIVDWRDGAARSGSDAYAWREGRLERVTMGP